MALPQGVHMRVEMLLCHYKEEVEEGVISRRSSMHVQSHSEWAPANIGPYSQAYTVSISKIIFIASEELLNLSTVIIWSMLHYITV